MLQIFWGRNIENNFMSWWDSKLFPMWFQVYASMGIICVTKDFFAIHVLVIQGSLAWIQHVVYVLCKASEASFDATTYLCCAKFSDKSNSTLYPYKSDITAANLDSLMYPYITATILRAKSIPRVCLNFVFPWCNFKFDFYFATFDYLLY